VPGNKSPLSAVTSLNRCYDRVPYDPFKNFDPVTLLASLASVLSVNPSVPANSVEELIRLIKSSAGKYSYASPRIGTVAHLLGEQFRIVEGLDLVHEIVPLNSQAR
jgi:tripartite-type tricarboxylate transporter receptor subunit TctC